MNKVIILIAAIMAQLGAHAQTTISLLADDAATGRVDVLNYAVSRQAEKTVVAMDFCLDSLRVPANRYRAFTPVLRSADNSRTQRLKTLIVSGRTQNIVFERDGIDPLYADNCDNLRRQNGQPQTYNYLDAVGFEPWHQDATIAIECDLCGCGDTLRSRQVALGRLLPPEPLDPTKLIFLADAQPSPSKPARNLHGTAFINFVVDRWEMKPDYMDNRRELRKITDTLNIMVADRNITVDRIKIHGWASPESPYAHNEMLATNRAQSLTDYIKSFYRLPDAVFARAEATPENWIGLLEALDTIPDAQLPHKAEFRQTCQKVLADVARGVTSQADRDELALKAKYRTEYDLLLEKVYPHLRRSDYEITFRIREFSLEEACQMYLLHPDQLSLYEFWAVAQTFERYSDDYNRCMQTAYNFYPDSAVAAVNLANVALREGNQLRAEALLRQAGQGAEAEQARAVLAILRRQYDEAEQHLAAAEALGLDVSRNRDAIRRLRETR